MKTLIKNATLVNEMSITACDVLIHNEMIASVAAAGTIDAAIADRVIDATGLHLFPGVIDDQVHFREPGLTHKGDLYTEPKAAVAGGVTSYMEMPNTNPPALTVDLLEQKYTRASEVSLANYSFFMGTSNTNLDEIKKIDPTQVCGLKIFMGSSTGNLVVDNEAALEEVFKEVKMLIATHCEDDPMIKENMAKYQAEYGDDIPAQFHPLIRSEEACYKSSSYAVSLAKKYGTRLHILHISTAKELELFRNDIPLKEKHITSEACIHHLWFSEEDYLTHGNNIKWNPAVKRASDRMAIREAVKDGRIDVIATDHAPHTKEEKAQLYAKAPSGGPLIQHTLVAMLDMYHQGVFSLELIADKMSHKVAELFDIDRRGFVREGYYADLVLVNLNEPWQVTPNNLLYKCQWSPFEGHTFQSKVKHTFVSGHHVYNDGQFDESKRGQRLTFNR